ncbi:hypothetical protein [Dyadobacter sp. 676]|uniref:Uncharacterized protein n=1 Tax=Dyadobacter sp. 676 TaxID=3088362 RepID=A0AAU8FTI4_9BACT
MESSTYCTSSIFGLITLLVVFTFHQAVRGSGTFAVLVAAWVAIQCTTALTGYFSITDTIFPRLLLVAAPPAVLMAWLFLAAPGKALMDRMNLDLLTMVHVVRAPIEVVMYWSFIDKLVPHEMTFGGGNPDILAGLSTPCVYYWGVMRSGMKWRLMVAWNFLCLGLLLNAIHRALLAAPFFFQTIGLDQPNVLVSHFPFVLLPGIVVPVLMCAHLVVIRNLVKKYGQEPKFLSSGRAVIGHFFS